MTPYADHDVLRVVIETPAGSRTKYSWDPALKLFRASKVMPLGMTFPYDFGFVPGTKAADGDPLDALVLADAPLGLGCLVECRVLGAIEVETDGERNDRLIVVPRISLVGASWHHLADLGERMVAEITSFLESYVKREGRPFKLVRKVDRPAALRLVEGALERS
jgi:inorganic pyrophosphatase